MNGKKTVTLRIQKAKERDIGKNLIRLDPKTMEDLGIKTGDVIAIKGNKVSAGIAWPNYPQDHGLGIIRFDSRLRKNTGTSIDDMIEIVKVNALSAKKVVLVPSSMKIKSNPKFDTFVRRKLINYPITLDDIIHISVGISREISFKVIGLWPEGVCQVKQNTDISISETEIFKEGDTSELITYKDIGGLEEEIQKIKKIIDIPLNQPSLINKLNINNSWGILLTGPPGCGKTLLAEAIINENFVWGIKISGPDILSKYEGESEKNLRKIFFEAWERSPSIVYIDQLDSIGMNRKILEEKKGYTIVSELLSLMDGLKKMSGVIVIASTNRPEVLDPALRRSGRFDVEIEINPPKRDARLDIFKIHTRDINLSPEISLEELADETNGFVGSDISSICREAKLNAIRKLIPEEKLESEDLDTSIIDKIEITKDDFNSALKNNRIIK